MQNTHKYTQARCRLIYSYRVATHSCCLLSAILCCSQDPPRPLLPRSPLLSHSIQSSQVWPSLWQDGGLNTWLHQRESSRGQEMKGREGLKGTRGIPCAHFHSLSGFQWDSARGSLPHISTSQRQALCFLYSLLKGKKCSPYQNKYGSLGLDHVS